MDGVRRDIWRYVTAAAQTEADILLEAAAVLGLSVGEVRTLAHTHFVLSREVRELLDGMPSLIRRLATTTMREEETSPDTVRGPVLWGPTLAAQAADGVRQRYVTAPARRAYDTPENQVLVAALNAVVAVGGRARNILGDGGLGITVRERVNAAERWMQARSLSSVRVVQPTTRVLHRVSVGRSRRRYRPAVAVVTAHRDLVRRLDKEAVRHTVEQLALVATADDRLFELVCVFEIERALRGIGWQTSCNGLLRTGAPVVVAHNDTMKLSLFFQHTPPALRAKSVYEQVQIAHGLGIGVLRPDFVLQIRDGGTRRWVLGEVKGGERAPETSAREALLDLLAYRREYHAELDSSAPPYGLGIAWGSELRPSGDGEVVLCTPDTILGALRVVLDS
jgi:hypothetical protein